MELGEARLYLLRLETHEGACHPAAAAATHHENFLDGAELFEELAQVFIIAARWTT